MTKELEKKKKPRKPRHRKLQREAQQQEGTTEAPAPSEPIQLTALVEKNTPYLDRYTEDLTEKISKKIENFVVFGRETEVRKTVTSLLRDTKNSPLLVGEAGVGKTAIVDGLVVLILKNQVPDFLKGVRVRSLELSSITSVTEGEDMIAKLKAIVEELKTYKESEILFIDEIHTIVGTGGNGSMLDAGNVIKPALARGEIQIIGATTQDEYQRSIETDPALERRFQTIQVDEPSVPQAKEIVRGIGPRFEKSKDLKIEESAYDAAVELSVRYIPERYLPDKAIDLIDQACAEANLDNRKSIAIEDIARVVESLKGVPITNILKSDYDQLMDLEAELQKRVKGQDHAIEAIAKAIYRNKEGLDQPNKPIGSFLFLGTSGVGKTELAKAVAELLFGSEDDMIRIDCSEYSSKGDKEKLIGKNEFGSQGTLTEQVKVKPYSVVLFDELDKGHRDIFDVMLQILDDGFVTTGLGRKIDFKNTIIIGTTNMGADEIRSTYESKGNFGDLDDYEYKTFMSRIDTELESFFRPEWLNRWDEKIVFNMLTSDIIESIVSYQMNLEINRLAKENIEFEYGDKEEFFDYLISKGTNVKDGARPLKRLINSQITGVLAKTLFQDRRGSSRYKVKAYIEGETPDMITQRKDYRYVRIEATRM
ncbi:TPA: ATP-dependent Clp protease ATP-binding subunit [Streptococcus suis]|nr:ATP-dependent Clp protease ATP-binding subunit [Streptococcus suis]